ncbi:PREDICTED: intercellular adhesion molecule 1 isoform X2 [Chinchilla lanigera]|uniref:Intercellular adhesion molecule 1 n=1 Tax=Chinchilla lanigera TaxID=34839 RepID=A0A8C2UYH7_CHILA|nr:PREDICTED: intercellular adhesion molecule 1 isoform X2 [Chinchilla lanigera]
MPEPQFGRGRREVSGKAAAPPLGPGPAGIKGRARSAPQLRRARAAAIRAPLAMAPLPALLALLGIALPAAAGNLEVHVSPREAILPRGASVLVNCSFSGCEQQSGWKLGLETQLLKVTLGSGSNWQLFELRGVLEDSSPMCFLTCPDGGQGTATVSITVYSFPEQVELRPLPPWQPAGQDLALRCLVVGGKPRDRLTAVLLRGQDQLSRQPVVGEPAEVTAPVRVGRADHLANFSCRTELDLRSQGLELFLNTSAARQLRTFVLPETPPQFATPGALEVGTRRRVACSLDGLFPVSEAKVHLALGDRTLNATVTYQNDSLSASAWLEVTAQEEGDRPLVCAVLLGNRSSESRRNLAVYSFPEPILTLNETEVSEGDLVMVTCEAHPGAFVTLSDAPAEPLSQKSQLLLNASAEDNGRRFSCSAALDVAGQLLYKNRTRQLTVLYGPRLDESDCPGNWTLPEGSQHTLRCQAWGNPPPQLRCHRKSDNSSLPIGSLRSIKRELAGTYLCRAVSPRGEVSREVLVTVLHDQGHMIIVIVLVVAGAIVGSAAVTAYFYNRQRKIRKYKLQKAAEALLLKSKPQLPEPAPSAQQQQQC